MLINGKWIYRSDIFIASMNTKKIQGKNLSCIIFYSSSLTLTNSTMKSVKRRSSLTLDRSQVERLKNLSLSN